MVANGGKNEGMFRGAVMVSFPVSTREIEVAGDECVMCAAIACSFCGCSL